MSFDTFLRDVMSQASLRERQTPIVVHVHGPVTINVNPAPEQITSKGAAVLAAFVPSGAMSNPTWAQAEKEEGATATQADPDAGDGETPDDSWKTPEVAEQLKQDMKEEAEKPAGFNGSLTKEELVRLTDEHTFSAQTAQRLYSFLTGWRFAKYLALRDMSLQVGDNGGFRKGDLRKVFPLLDPNDPDKLLFGYGETQHRLLQAVVK